MFNIEREVSAPSFWKELISKNPIIAVTGVIYNPQPHGIPSKNELIEEHEGMILEFKLSEDAWPKFGTRDRDGKTKPQTFAIGSLVYWWPGRDDGPSYIESKFYAKHLRYEMESNLDCLKKYGIIPMALVMLDFDCPNSKQNMARINKTLSSKYQNQGWTLFDTGQSFHLIIDGFVNPKNIPWHWGKIIKTFASQESGWQKEFFTDIGNALMHGFNNPKAIKEIHDYIILMTKHPNESSPNKTSFIIDLRWIAHSLVEFLNYIDTGKGSFGFLRISDKDGSGSPPKIVLRHSP